MPRVQSLHAMTHYQTFSTPRWPLPRALALLVLVLAMLPGCAAKSDYMRPATSPQPAAAPPDGALVVFLRPSSMANRNLFTILDGNGRFLGESPAGSRFAVKLPPGEHLFVATGESSEGLRANLVAGRTYYVEVSPRMGAWRARVDLLAIAPRLPSWKNLQDWLKETEALEPNTAAGQASLDAGDVQEALRNAKQGLAELSREDLMERTLLPDDGVPAAGAPAAAPPPVPPPLAAPAGAPPAAPAQPPAPQPAAPPPAGTQPAAPTPQPLPAPPPAAPPK